MHAFSMASVFGRQEETHVDIGGYADSSMLVIVVLYHCVTPWGKKCYSVTILFYFLFTEYR